ncbi:MAG: hypothetical protein ABJF79_06670 [Paracoccaceae bacterium]
MYKIIIFSFLSVYLVANSSAFAQEDNSQENPVPCARVIDTQERHRLETLGFYVRSAPLRAGVHYAIRWQYVYHDNILAKEMGSDTVNRVIYIGEPWNVNFRFNDEPQCWRAKIFSIEGGPMKEVNLHRLVFQN